MPRLEEALYDYLTTEPGVAALVDDRVYAIVLPEGATLPAVSWRRVSAQRIYTYDAFESTDAWVSARVQFDCWSFDPLEAINVGEAILLALSGYEGDMSGQLIGSSFGVNEFDTFEERTKLHRRTLDFQVAYEDDLTPAS